MVRADEPDPSLRLHGVVSHDGGEALFALVSVATSFAEVPGRIGLPGLLPDAVYRVEAVYPAPATTAGPSCRPCPRRGLPAASRRPAGSWRNPASRCLS